MSEIRVMQRGGKMVDLTNLQPEDIDFEQIFTTMSKKGRWNDQYDNKVSILDHSLLVFSMATIAKESDIVCLTALLHDASEAFIGDIPGPLKRSSYVKPVSGLEYNIQSRILDKAFGFTGTDYQTLLDVVHKYDIAAQAVEVPFAFNSYDKEYWDNSKQAKVLEEIPKVPWAPFSDVLRRTVNKSASEKIKKSLAMMDSLQQRVLPLTPTVW